MDRNLRSSRVEFLEVLGVRVRFVQDLRERVICLPKSKMFIVDQEWSDELPNEWAEEIFGRSVSLLGRLVERSVDDLGIVLDRRDPI